MWRWLKPVLQTGICMRGYYINNEDGSALILALGMVVLVSLLALSIVTVSQMTDKLSKSVTDRSKAAYLAESAADRMIWLLSWDIRKYPNRVLGGAGNSDQLPRVLADSSTHIHKFENGWSANVTIKDAVSGYDISGSNPTAYLRRREREFEEDEFLLEEYKTCLSCLKDYVDANDFTQLIGGLESEGYDALGLTPLPRNKPLEYREEILWIPGFDEFLSLDAYGQLSNIRIIAPRGMRGLRGKPNFFTADKGELNSMARMDDQQIASILEARNTWMKDSGGKPFSEGLSIDMMSSLRRSYSFRESGCYTFSIKIVANNKHILRVFNCSLCVNRNLVSGKTIQYYDWMFLL